MDDTYIARLDALEETWQIWAQLGAHLTDEQWSRPTRCPGWDVAALFAHHSAFPQALNAPPPTVDGSLTAGEPVTAGEILRRFNSPDGVAHTMAGTVADQAVSDVSQCSRGELVDRFAVHGQRALQQLRQAEPTMIVPWPASGAVVTLGEALRIVLMEATIHLLDAQRALDQPPFVPTHALGETAQLLVELAPAVEFIEAASGRSPHPPLPVLR